MLLPESIKEHTDVHWNDYFTTDYYENYEDDILSFHCPNCVKKISADNIGHSLNGITMSSILCKECNSIIHVVK